MLKQIKEKIAKKKTFYLMLLPSLFFFIIFFVYPMINGLRIGFYSWNGISRSMDFIGIENFKQMISNKLFRTAFINTSILTIAALGIQISLGFVLAWWAFKHSKIGYAFMWFVYLPMVVSFIAVGMMWHWMYDPNIGVINAVLKGIGLGSVARAWLASRTTGLLAIIITGVWYGTGFCVLLFAASLGSIPQSIYDSMKVDGLSNIQSIRYVVLPQLKNVIAVAFIFISCATLKTFDLVFALTGGAPARSTEVVTMYMWRESFGALRAGYACAVGLTLLVLGILLSVLYLRITRVK